MKCIFLRKCGCIYRCEIIARRHIEFGFDDRVAGVMHLFALERSSMLMMMELRAMNGLGLLAKSYFVISEIDKKKTNKY